MGFRWRLAAASVRVSGLGAHVLRDARDVARRGVEHGVVHRERAEDRVDEVTRRAGQPDPSWRREPGGRGTGGGVIDVHEARGLSGP